MGFAFALRHCLLQHCILSKKINTKFPLPVRSTKQLTMGSIPTQQRIFQLKTNPLTGQSEWVVMEDNNSRDEPNSMKEVLAHTSYLDMLNDRERNRAFDLAIRKIIRRPCHVLDIGAGTGLLSMMSLRAMRKITCPPEDFAEMALVTACESYLPMFKLARKVLRLNGMQDRIRLIHKRSDELQIGADLPSRADILVSEILDSELLGEGLIPTLQHAHDHLVIRNVETIPYKATVYGQVVQSDFLSKLQDLHGCETLASDGLFLVPAGSESSFFLKRSQYAMHCNAFCSHLQILSEPFKVFDFDFWKRPDDHQNIELKVKITAKGHVQAIISWWVLQLDKDGTIFYSTAPKWIQQSLRNSNSKGSQEFYGGSQWCNHWKQCVWLIPGSGLSVSPDEEIIVQAAHNAVSIQYGIGRNSMPASQEYWRNISSEDYNLFMKPERISVIGDKDWRSAVLSVVKQSVQGRSSPLCVVVDDSLPLSVIVASLSSSRVFSLFPGFGINGQEYLAKVATQNGFSFDCVKVLGKKANELTIDDIEGCKVDILLAEPFYIANEGMLPWQNLRFWNERTALAPLLSETATIVPFKGILRACAMYLPDLWRSRCSLKDVDGFDHSVVNEILGACGELPDPVEGPLLPFAIVQCGQFEEISEEFTLLEFDFTKDIQRVTGKVKVPFSKFGICHGLVLWIDWVMDSNESIIISTKPGQGKRFWSKQGVKLIRHPIKVGNINCKLNEKDILNICYSCIVEGVFEPSNGILEVKLNFTSS